MKITTTIAKELKDKGIDPEKATHDQIVAADKAIMKRLRKIAREL